MSPLVNRDSLLELLRSHGAKGPAVDTEIDAETYDWKRPHRFNDSHLTRISEMSRQTAKLATEEIQKLTRTTTTVEFSQVSERYTSDVVESDTDECLYYASFNGPDDTAAGAVSIDEKTARTWLKCLLGDGDDEEEETTENAEFSPLEQSLLADIAGGFVRSLARAHGRFRHLSVHGDITPGALPSTLEKVEEWVRIDLRIRQDGEEAVEGKAAILIRSSDLDGFAGRQATKSQGLSPDAESRAMLEHANEMSVSVRVNLGDVRLTLEELMSLAPNDVLLLDRMAGEAIDIEVEGQPLFRGRPAKSAGRNAVVITGPITQT